MAAVERFLHEKERKEGIRLQRIAEWQIKPEEEGLRAFFNPAVCLDVKGNIHIFPRVIDWEIGADRINPNVTKRGAYISRLSHFVIRNGGVNGEKPERVEDPVIVFDESLSPTLVADLEQWQKNGVEDPRIIYDEENNEYIATMVFLHKEPFPPDQQAVTVVAKSRNLHEFRVIGIATPSEIQEDSDDRDTVIFPEKINGKWYVFQRPQKLSLVEYPDKYAYHAYGSTDLETPPALLLATTDYLTKIPTGVQVQDYIAEWENTEMGAGAPPLKTDKGWLCVYNAVEKVKIGIDAQGKDILQNQFRVGAVLRDLNDPHKIVSRLDQPLLVPETKDEMEEGDACPYVVFATGAFIDVDDNLVVAFGGGDKVTEFAKAKLADVLDAMAPVEEPSVNTIL